MKTNVIMNTWSRGELSPQLDGRTDVEAYFNGGKIVENFFITPHGGLKRRPGTYFVAEVKTSAKSTRLIPFQFSTTQAYIIEMGDGYMRFYKDRGQIESGGSPYEIVSPYVEADLFDVQFVQDADTMYLVHPSYKPRKLTRTGHTSWSIDNYAPTADPFTSADNYPSCVVIYEQRLVFANTNTDPQKIWASKSGDYEDMTTGSNDADALVYTIGSKQVNAIRWLSSGKVLLFGTLASVFSMSSGSNQDPLTPTNVIVKRESSFGSIGILPKEIGNYVYYLHRNKKIVYEIAYSLEFDEYKANEVTLVSDHITGDEIVDWDYQQAPYSMILAVRSDGEIAALTRQVEQKVLGWSRIITNGEFESVAVIPGDGSDDEIWVVVRRYINGSYVRYVEYFKPTIYSEQEDGYFVDCGVTLDSPLSVEAITNANPAVVTITGHGLSNANIITIRNVVGMTELNGHKYKVANKTDNTFELTDTDDNDIDSTTYGVYQENGEVRKCYDTLSGLDHLEAETVSVCGDGAALSDEVVSGAGAITIDTTSGEIHAGLTYTSTLQTMRLESGQDSGTAQGKLKKINRAIVRLYESLGCSIGTDVSQDDISFLSEDDETDVATTLFTGDKEISFPGTFDQDAYVVVKQEQPLPLNILAIILFFTTNES